MYQQQDILMAFFFFLMCLEDDILFDDAISAEFRTWNLRTLVVVIICWYMMLVISGELEPIVV